MPRPAIRPFHSRQFKGPLILRAINEFILSSGAKPVEADEFCAAYTRAILRGASERAEAKERTRAVPEPESRQLGLFR